MEILIAISAAAAPTFLLVAAWGFPALRYWIEGAALVSAYLFGVLAAVYTVCMLDNGTAPITDLHSTISNRLLLASGTYLGVYVLYKMALGWLRLWRE